MLGTGGASVISGFDILGPEIHFTSIGLWDVTDNIIMAPGTIVTGAFAGFTSFTTELTSDHNYDIVVEGGLNPGQTSGSYSGNISISPVPETYVMLLIGLCTVYFVLSRRHRIGVTRLGV